MRAIALRAPAKINLILKVLGKRPDGYHDLKTVFQRLDLCDDLTFTPNTSGNIRIFCDHPQVPKGPRNLVYKVAQSFQTDYQVGLGADIHITKRIPVAAGLAGGSSNAAAALLGLNRAWGLKLSQDRLLDHARRIGSDVPFFLYDCPWALGTERGDRLEPLAVETRLWQVLVVPRIKMYSGEVFTRWSLLRGPGPARGGILPEGLSAEPPETPLQGPQNKLTKMGDGVNILLHSLRKKDLKRVGLLLCNDLEPSILDIRPGLAKVKDRISRLPLAGVSFSGSGPAIFGVAFSQQEARAAGDILSRFYRQVFVVRTR